jgi:hypothetical protein
MPRKLKHKRRRDHIGMWATIGDAVNGGWGSTIRMMGILTIPSITGALLFGDAPVGVFLRAFLRSIM